MTSVQTCFNDRDGTLRLDATEEINRMRKSLGNLKH